MVVVTVTNDYTTLLQLLLAAACRTTIAEVANHPPFFNAHLKSFSSASSEQHKSGTLCHSWRGTPKGNVTMAMKQ